MANIEKKALTSESKIFITIIVVIIAAIVGYMVYYYSTPGKLDAFAQCLDEETTFYGAFWCPNCQNQKAMFGKSSKLLPYIECSTPDGQNMLEECQDAGIRAYPTWEFADGSRIEGQVPLTVLAEKSGCELPEDMRTRRQTETSSGESSDIKGSLDEGGVEMSTSTESGSEESGATQIQ